MTTHSRTALRSCLLCVTLGALGTAGCGATAVVGTPADASVPTDRGATTPDVPATPVDVPVGPPPDRPATTPDVPTTMPITCPLVGWYVGSIESNAVVFEFTADGVWRGFPSADTDIPPVVEGTYSLVGSALALTGERSPTGSSSAGCAMTDRGDYTLNFTADCASLRFSVRSDDCEGRGRFFSQVTLARH